MQLLAKLKILLHPFTHHTLHIEYYIKEIHFQRPVDETK